MGHPARHRDNLHEGPNLTCIDPESEQVSRLFHPGGIGGLTALLSMERLAGPTAVGRATIQVLDVNDPRRLELRAEIGKRDPFK